MSSERPQGNARQREQARSGARTHARTEHPVVLIPGFLCGDDSLGMVARALEEAGHPVHLSGIRWNADCAEAAVVRLLERVAAVADEHGRRVALVGHSRGGLFARVIATRRPDLVSGVVALASPHRDHGRVHPLLMAQALALATLGLLGVPGVLRPSCGAGRCCEPFRRDLAARPASTVGLLSIYSRSDRIVDWRACREIDGRHAEVTAGHYQMPTHEPTIGTIVSALMSFDAGPPAGRATAE